MVLQKGFGTRQRGSYLLPDMAGCNARSGSSEPVEESIQTNPRKLHRLREGDGGCATGVTVYVRVIFFHNSSVSDTVSSYLSVYQRGKIEKYIDVHNEWNVSRILGYLQSPNFRNTLDELPPPIFYHILYNPALLAHPKIWPIVRNLLPSRVVSWMPRPAPAGFIFLLLIPGTPRNFVSVQLQKTPLPTVEEVGSRDSHYVRAYNAILVAMANSTDERISLPSSSLLYSMVDGTTSESLWSSIPTIIQRFKGVERARIEITDRGIDGKKKYATFLGLTINHLSRHDQGIYFISQPHCVPKSFKHSRTSLMPSKAPFVFGLEMLG